MQIEYTVIFTNVKTQREIHENQKYQHPSGAMGWNSVKVGDEEVVFNVAIDKSQLAQMARIAARNKSQKCKDGAVLVEIVKRTRL